MLLLTVCQTPAALLQQISSLRSEKQDKDPGAQIISQPAEHKKKGLIQVISTTFEQPQKPEFQLEVKTDTAGVPRMVELTVDMPKVHSMSESQLKISKVSRYTQKSIIVSYNECLLCVCSLLDVIKN